MDTFDICCALTQREAFNDCWKTNSPPPWFLTPAATVLEYPQRLSFPRPASNQMWFPPSPVGRNFVGGGGGGIFRRTTSLTFLSQGFLIKRTGTKRRRRRSRDRLLFLNQANFRLLSLKINFLRPCFPTKSWPVSCDTSPSFSQFPIFRLTLENFLSGTIFLLLQKLLFVSLHLFSSFGQSFGGTEI